MGGSSGLLAGSCVTRETGFQLQSWLIAWAEHFGRSLPSATILASPSGSRAVHRGPFCPVGSPRARLQHSHPDRFVFLSTAKPPVRPMQIPPGSPCCKFLSGFTVWRSWHGGITPISLVVSPARAKSGCLKPFSPVPGFLCSCLGSENHNKGEV